MANQGLMAKVEKDIRTKKNELERLPDEIANLEKMRDLLEGYQSKNGTKHTSKLATKLKAPKTKGDSTAARITRMLEKRGPMKFEDIYTELKRTGWKSENKDPRKTVHAALAYGNFKRTASGAYGVKG